MAWHTNGLKSIENWWPRALKYVRHKLRHKAFSETKFPNLHFLNQKKEIKTLPRNETLVLIHPIIYFQLIQLDHSINNQNQKSTMQREIAMRRDILQITIRNRAMITGKSE